MMTPEKIQELAEPIEAVYASIVDELLINIAKHVRSPTWTHTAVWEIQKLSELGQLTQENAAIINRWIKEMPQEIRDTMEATRAEALKGLEKQMEAALKKGYVVPPLSDSTVQVLEELSAQAVERLNLVNTTMLQSSLEQYARAIQLTAEDVRKAENTQRILNEAAGSAVTGAETRRQAVRRAISRIADEGLTGFVDRAGRHWTPEAYVNMDIRTTVHNTAIQETHARMEDYGTSVFQVSSHAGARPGCYPYQGKFYSWDNSTGEIPLGNGGTAHYEPINSTTYGQPAGLFGINCGHYPIVVIPGYTIPHGADNIQPKAENDKAYAESQQQRALERKIREEKRRVEMLGSTATKEDRERVRQAQARMREFINTTGRTRRLDREQIVENKKKNSLQKGQGGGIINLTKVSERGEVLNPMPETEYRKIVSRLKRNGVEVFAATDGDDLRYMLALGAEGTYSNGRITHIGNIPSRGTLLEEIIHFTQSKKYGELASTDYVELYVREIEANRKLLKFQDAYRLDKQDVSDIERNLANWEESFKTMTGEAYDESNYRNRV